MYIQFIKDAQESIKRSNFIRRAYTFPQDLLVLDKIISFVGARRVWKTTIMKQVIHDLIDSWMLRREQLVRIDGNEINPMTFDVKDIVESFYSIEPDLTPFFVIDEVREMKDWVRQLFFLYNKWYKILISWSNAHLLSSEISTKLRWKVYDQRIYWLTWHEYKQFVGFDDKQTTQWVWERMRIFNQYLTYWWFPEVSLIKNEDIKIWLLRNYFDVLLYKDLIERYKIDKEFVIKQLIKYIWTTITKEFSVTKFINQLKSQWVSITKSSIYNYLEYLENIFYMYPVRKKWSQRGSIKYYLYNRWYTSLREKEWYGKKLENIVMNTVKQSWIACFYTVNSAWEIDIDTEDRAFQISRKLGHENSERETASLLYTTKSSTLVFVHREKNQSLPAWITYMSVFDFLYTQENR